MSSLDWDDLTAFVEKKIAIYHQKKLDNLCSLKLESILKRKNPYLFKAKNLLTASDLVRTLLDAHLSSQEETIFARKKQYLVIFLRSLPDT